MALASPWKTRPSHPRAEARRRRPWAPRSRRSAVPAGQTRGPTCSMSSSPAGCLRGRLLGVLARVAASCGVPDLPLPCPGGRTPKGALGQRTPMKVRRPELRSWALAGHPGRLDSSVRRLFTGARSSRSDWSLVGLLSWGSSQRCPSIDFQRVRPLPSLRDPFEPARRALAGAVRCRQGGP